MFGIQVGVGVTLAIRKKSAPRVVRYHRVPDYWRRSEKLDFLLQGHVPWSELHPDARSTWRILENADEYDAFTPVKDMFSLYSVGVKTNRDDVVYDWQRETLTKRIKATIALYNSEVHRHKPPGADAVWDSAIAWSAGLKQNAMGGRLAEFDEAKLRVSLYRPFAKKWLFFDRILNERIYQWSNMSGTCICITAHSQVPFSAQMTDTIPNEAPGGRQGQCFPLSHLKDEALTLFRTHYTDDTITKEAIFNYIYALLHHPEYRDRYAANLKRELPRIPFAPDFHAFASAGKELARLHVDYESLQPWPLEHIENKSVPWSERVLKMKLSPDKRTLCVNPSLTLNNIPPETFDYRLGSRSALEWIIDQYQVKGDSDPNRPDDPGYIIRLIGQVVRVSIETAGIVKSLPPFRV